MTTVSIVDWPAEYLSPLQSLINTTICYENGPLPSDFSDFILQTIGDHSLNIEERQTTIIDMMISSVLELTNEEEQRKAFQELLNPCITYYESIIPKIQTYEIQLREQQKEAEERKKIEQAQKVENALKAATLNLFYQQDDDHDEEAQYEAEQQAGRSSGSNTKSSSNSSNNNNTENKRTVHLNTKDFKSRASMYDNFMGELDSSGQSPDTSGLGRRAKRAALKQHEDKKNFGLSPVQGNKDQDKDSSDDDDNVGMFIKNSSNDIPVDVISSSSPSNNNIPQTNGPRSKKNDKLVSIDYLEIKNDNHERMKQLENERKLKLHAEAQAIADMEKEKAAAARAARELAMNNRNKVPQK